MALPWGVVYRPRTIDEMVGNKELVSSIQRGMKAKDLPQRLLIHGPTGAGKTTLAYILTEWFTGLPYDPNADSFCVNETNCASENGIKEVRDLIDASKMRPMVGKRRVIILDEAQELTKAAKSALLKPLEEDNDVVWILLTNEPEKLSDVMRGRVNKMGLQWPNVDDLLDLAEDVHKSEKCKFAFPEKGLTYLAEQVRNVRLFLNSMQDVYKIGKFDDKSVDEAILRAMEATQISSIDNLVAIVRYGKVLEAVNLMSVYTFWCELLSFYICTTLNISGSASEPNYIRTLFSKRLGTTYLKSAQQTLADLHKGKAMVTMHGCDGTATFVSLFTQEGE